MSRRYHIIYAHTAGRDGYDFYYLYYWPGDRQLSLRYRQHDDEIREVTLAPVAMLDLIENQAALHTLDVSQVRPWDRAAKALRTRIKSWMDQARDDE